MSSKNSISIIEDEIRIDRKEWPRSAITTFREDYYEELSSVTWTLKNGYLHNTKFGYLHRYVMRKWYGETLFSHMTQHNWVVDHMNGNKMDCRISNLEFLPIRYNVAKGQTIDVDSERLRMHIALTLCKDFTTGYYQIHIGCNDDISLYDVTQHRIICHLARISFLYNLDYQLVISDAISILLNYKFSKKINISTLQCIDWKAEPTVAIALRENEIGQPIIARNGSLYANIGNGIWFYSSGVEKGWAPKHLTHS